MQDFQTTKSVFARFITAACLYAGFAVYLFLPYFQHFDMSQCFLPVNICFGCLGCYVLSRRWVGAFVSSFFAGAVYGFGPYVLGLIKFHPMITFLAAVMPWMFCPAALIQNRRWRWLSALLSILPFVAIVLFFKMTTHLRLFPIPIQAKIQSSDFVGLLAPLVMSSRSEVLVGFYHVPAASLAMGFFMLLVARRFGVLAILVIGAALAFCKPFLNVSPIIWLTVPVLCCSVIIGEGMQGFVLAGRSDRKWVLVIIILMGVLAIVTLLLATRYFEVFAGLGKSAARLFTDTAKLYLLGASGAVVVFFMAGMNRRVTFLRLAVLCLSMAVDIFLGARFIVDRIF